jgi:hypothetical protein
MNDESNIEDVEQDVKTDFEPQIGDLDTAEGQARRAEEAHLEEMWETDNPAEGLEDLPPADEAQLGELCRTPEGGQFEGCSLLGGKSGDLIEAITGGDI